MGSMEKKMKTTKIYPMLQYPGVGISYFPLAYMRKFIKTPQGQMHEKSGDKRESTVYHHNGARKRSTCKSRIIPSPTNRNAETVLFGFGFSGLLLGN